MEISKRALLQSMAAGAGMVAMRGASAAAPRSAAARDYRRYSCEESFTTPEVVTELSRLAGGVPSMKSGPIAGPFMANLLDIGAGRIRNMDADGVDVQILSLVSPGVQAFAADTALSMAHDVNDRMAAAIKAYPTRLAGLATLAPQAAGESAKELERCIHTLKLQGGIINSHTNGEYLDNIKYWPLFEAAQALEVPIYLHPRDPSPGLELPLAVPGFAVGWAYAVETGTHAIRLVGAGVFDRFPKLQIVLGHLGETLPFLIDRIDNRFAWQMDAFRMKSQLQRRPSDYLRDNFVYTTSGMNYEAPVLAAIKAMGADKVIFSADYPMEVQKDAVEGMEAIPLTPAVRKQMFETNARRVFKL
jgi:2,3-dihydroxybenzoate decarboxylase